MQSLNKSFRKTIPKSIWVVQTSFIGDVVLSLPFLAELARLSASAESSITVFTRSGACSDLLHVALGRGLAPFRNRITVVPIDKKKTHKSIFGMRRLVQELEAKGLSPDRVYCLQRSFRSGLFAFLSGAAERIGFSSGGASFFYTQSVARQWESGRLEIDKNLDLLRATFSVDDDERAIAWDALTAPSLLRSSAEPRKTALHKDDAVVALSTGSPWFTKRWPIEQSAPFVKNMILEGVEVQLLGDATNVTDAAAIEASFASPMLKNLAGKTSIQEWVDAIAQVDMLVSGDSAAVHVASDLNVPVVALFGPTVPEFGFAPWRRGSVVLGLTQLACRPCDIHGPKVCPLGHHACLKQLDSETVVRQSLKILKK